MVLFIAFILIAGIFKLSAGGLGHREARRSGSAMPMQAHVSNDRRTVRRANLRHITQEWVSD